MRISHKAPHPLLEENVTVCLFYGNFFVYVYTLGMALMLQLRICLATTLSSMLSNRFLLYLSTSHWTLHLEQPINSPLSLILPHFLHEVINVMAVIFWLVKKNLFLQFEDGM